MLSRMQLRRGTSAHWAAHDPILLIGELGYDTNQKKIKVGDGTTPWSSLSFISADTSGSPGGGGLVNTTYAQLYNWAGTQTLCAGTFYRISDFRTRHAIPSTAESNGSTALGDTYDTPIEPLIVFASSSSTIDSGAFSEIYPDDTVTYTISGYCDYERNLVLPGTRWGAITYRKDSVGNECRYDFRTTLWRRWQRTKPELYGNNTSVDSNAEFDTPWSNAETYRIISSGVSEIVIAGSSLSGDTYWCQNLNYTRLPYKMYLGQEFPGIYTVGAVGQDINGDWVIQVEENVDFSGMTSPQSNIFFYKDFTTFNFSYSTYNNSLGGMGYNEYGTSDIVFMQNAVGNKFRTDCYSLTFTSESSDNEFGHNVRYCTFERLYFSRFGNETHDIFGGYGVWNVVVGDRCRSLWFASNANENVVGMNSNLISFIGDGNNIGTWGRTITCRGQGNNTGVSCTNTIIAGDYNTIDDESENIYLGEIGVISADHNIIGKKCFNIYCRGSRNIIDSGCSEVYISDNSYSNKLGSECERIYLIATSCSQNVFAQRNKNIIAEVQLRNFNCDTKDYVSLPWVIVTDMNERDFVYAAYSSVEFTVDLSREPSSPAMANLYVTTVIDKAVTLIDNQHFTIPFSEVPTPKWSYYGPVLVNKVTIDGEEYTLSARSYDIVNEVVSLAILEAFPGEFPRPALASYEVRADMVYCCGRLKLDGTNGGTVFNAPVDWEPYHGMIIQPATQHIFYLPGSTAYDSVFHWDGALVLNGLNSDSVTLDFVRVQSGYVLKEK